MWICSKTIACNHKKIACNSCKHKVHIKCTRFDKNDYNRYQKSECKTFFCVNCIKENMHFSDLNDNEFYVSVKMGTLHNSEIAAEFVPSDFQKKVLEQLNTAINNNAFDLDADETDDYENEDIIPALNCNYYTLDEFLATKFNSSKNFSILHYNIHSVERHIDEFRVVLDMINFKFDVICISESKIIKDIEPKIDINIEGYQSPVGTPTQSTKGGVLIYVKNGLQFKPRLDLNMYKAKVLESFFIEVSNKNESNDIIGVVYRHPCMDESDFNEEYLKCLVDRLSGTNKKLFIAGDFNFNLLNSNTHEETFTFFDTMMSNFLLPVINLPTKINRVNNSLIDNIFTNHLHPDAKSGNLSINLCDGHLPSFLILPRQNQNHLPKKHNILTRNTNNFNLPNFLHDFDNTNWDQAIELERNDVHYSIEQFLSKFNLILDKYMPLQK